MHRILQLVLFYHRNEKIEERVIAYFSRTLTRSERNYCVTRKELLAVVKAIEHFNYYLHGLKFRVRTDHSPLQWLMNFMEPQGQVARWIEKLQTYDFIVEHRSGSAHRMLMLCPDVPALRKTASNVRYEERFQLKTVSRVTRPVIKESETNRGSVEKDSETLPVDVDKWKEKQGEDGNMKSLIEALKDGKKRPRWAVVTPFGKKRRHCAQWDSLRLVDGIMYRVWEHPRASDETLQIVVPKALRKQIFDLLHDSKTGGHFGINKTIGKIKAKFYWPKLRDDVKKWCAQCDLCSARKGPSRKIKAPLASYVVGSPMERVAVDVWDRYQFRRMATSIFLSLWITLQNGRKHMHFPTRSRNSSESIGGSIRFSFWDVC
ncbi:Hypothetical predicted protein [Paramuricea clavata]|uniref:Uncharacterized protein n=1 Tax=Paramuricea clavata TaxID=317549 RepID=A0A6S7ISX1_PARCT|nr:Hypothetical predicted protein [Paramuricea clavata]